jgi:hypothetical protein
VEPACFSIYSEGGVNDLTITISDLTNVDSNIGSSNVTAYQVIHSERQLGSLSLDSYSLLPDHITDFNSLSVEQNTSETIWLKVNIPDKDAGLAAGLYTGQITITRPGEPNVYVPIDVNVYDITLDEPNSIYPVWPDGWYRLSSNMDTVYSMVSEAGLGPFVSWSAASVQGINMIDISDPCDTNNIVFDDQALKDSIDESRAKGFLKNYVMLYIGIPNYAGKMYELVTNKDYDESDPNLWDNLSDPCFVYWFGELIDRYEEIGDACGVTFLYFPYDEPLSHPDRRIINDRLCTIIHAHNGLTAVTYSTTCEIPCPNDCGGQDNCPEEGYYNVPTTNGKIPELTELIDYKMWALSHESAGYAKHQNPAYHGQFGYYHGSQNYNPVYNRFLDGLFASRTDATAVFGFKLGCGTNDPYNDFDLAYNDRFSDHDFYYSDFLYSYPTWSGKIWYGIGGIEATREGIKDSRYFATLKRLITEEPNDVVAQDAQEYLDELESRINPDYMSYKNQSTELGHYQAILKAISSTSDQNDFEAFTQIRKKIADYIVLIQDGNVYRCHNETQDKWYTTIQDAIDEASAGDTIVVADGTYTGDGNRNVDFQGKAITVKSTNGPENCIINCEGSRGTPRCGFIFDSSEGRSSVLDGFTITNGYGRYLAFDAMYAGGAIICERSSPTIRRCILKDNMNDKTNSDTYGGAIACYEESYGGANPLIENCTIYDNDAYYGGGISVVGTSSTIRNCVIRSNSAERGGAIDLAWGYTVDINNCTVVNNSADSGGGINSNSSTETITNCILWGNGDDLYDCSTTYSCTSDCNDVNGTNHNICADPCFADADANNFHLSWNSPCINKGDPNGNYDGQLDIDNYVRVIDSHVDIGADETCPPDAHLWKLDETSGTTTYDSVDTNNGAFNGDDPCWVTGKFNGAVDFNGVNDYFSVASLDSAYDAGSIFTIAGWFKTSQSEGSQTIVGQWSQDGGFYYGWQVLVESNKVVAKFGGDVGMTEITGIKNVTDGEWHHFALANNGSSSAVLYVDGELDGTYGPKYMEFYGTKFRIGDGSYGNGTLEGGPFNGVIDDVMIFNRLLSAEEAGQLYEGGL